ncbi:MAG: hypothetical protein FWD23_11240 [Oscillospiraceae bacterium]|nr:hypothetical protein [Oscillospiraceae bacterium]
MKKVLAIIICVLFLAGMTVVPVSADPTINVPKAQTAPTLDGVIDPEEWANAYRHDLRPGSGVEMFDAYHSGLATYQGSVFWYMWHEDGLYAAADVKMDMSTFETPVRGEANFVSGSIQFCVWDENGGGTGDMKLWLTCHVEAADGSPVITNANVGMDDAPGIEMAAVKNANGYTAEVLISTAALAEHGINVASGGKLMILTDTIYWDTDADTVECACDSPDWSALYTYVLTDAAAGRAPQAAEEAPAGADPVADNADPAPGAAADDTPAAAEEAPARPASVRTGDTGFVIIILVMAAAAGIFAVIRRKNIRQS